MKGKIKLQKKEKESQVKLRHEEMRSEEVEERERSMWKNVYLSEEIKREVSGGAC